MGFGSLNRPEVDDLIERFAGARAITLVVGAGASMEASLPSWPGLIEALLRRVAADHPRLEDPDVRDDWIRWTLERDDLLAAGAVVEVMAADELETLLPEELYGPEGPSAYEPGPIAHQVAAIRASFGDAATILTTNYDDLIERALQTRGYSRANIKSYVRRRSALPQDAVPVTHLHGYAGRGSKPKRLVLTEEHYHRMQRGKSWQEQYVTERLEGSVCLFVGTSLTDPNLIRYLYGYEQSDARRHAAVFVRQGDLDDAHPEVRAVREEAVMKRWARCGVEAVFVDHFADAGQLLYEIRHRRERADDYKRVADRASRGLDAIRRVALRVGAGDDAFRQRQVGLSDWLRRTLYLTLASALGGDPPEDERLALALWLLSNDGRTLTGWAHSDRAHQDPATIEAVPVRPSSTWVAVRTVCQGVRVELDRQSEVSRWRFVRGLPLIIDEPSRLPVGCLTISSTKPGAQSVLTQMSSDAKAAFHGGLLEAITPTLTSVVITSAA